MAIIVTIGDPLDGTLKSQSFLHEGGNNANGDFENDARSGSQLELDPGQDPISGQRLAIGGQKWNSGSQTSRYESFIAFRAAQGFVPPSNIGDIELVNLAVRVSSGSNQNDSTNPLTEALVYYERPWDAPLSSSNWVDLMPLLTNPQIFDIGGWGYDKAAYNLYETSSNEFFNSALTHLTNGTDVELMMTLLSAINTYGGDKSFLRWVVAASNLQVNQKFRPTIIHRYQRRHALNHVLGSSIQLTDGTAVFLRWDAVNERVSLYYQKVTATTPTLIANLQTKTPTHDNSAGAAQYWGIEPGAQTFGITRDGANNLYITGPRGNPQNTVEGQKVYNVGAFKYNGSGGNHSWQLFTQSTSGENSEANNFTHRGRPNNFAPVWLPNSEGGAFGQLVTMHSRRDSHWSRFQLGFATDYAGWWLGSGAGGKRHGVNYLAGPDSQYYWRPWNGSGTGMDAFADGDTIRWAGFIQALRNEDLERSAAGSVGVSPTGVVATPTPNALSLSTNSPHDPDAKVRCVWMGTNSPYYAIARHGHIQVLRKSDGAIFKQVDLPTRGVAGFPARVELQSSAAWDILWDSGTEQWLWIYYRSTLNSRIVKKVRWNYVTDVMDTAYDFTAEPLGPSGSSIVALRVPRQQVDTRCVLLDVAMQDGAGTPLSLITVRDTTMDVPPNPPIVQTITSFNAAGTKAIEWIFTDENPDDFATFQDVEIRNVATGAIAHTASHVTAAIADLGTRRYRYTVGANVLSNDANYQVRFRAYDAVDVAGDFSQWVAFSTTATGGLVQITEPAGDLEPLNKSSVTISWSYSNSTPGVTQTGYRVRVYNDTNNAIVSDTGVVASTATTRQITGLVSDVTYRIEVSVRDSNNQTSGAGVRLVYPDFNNPSLPSITAIAGKGYIEIRVSNPPPDGENPVTDMNQIARRESTQLDTEYVIIGECPPNGVFRDWTVASGVQYVYKARGQS